MCGGRRRPRKCVPPQRALRTQSVRVLDSVLVHVEENQTSGLLTPARRRAWSGVRVTTSTHLGVFFCHGQGTDSGLQDPRPHPRLVGQSGRDLDPK